MKPNTIRQLSLPLSLLVTITLSPRFASKAIPLTNVRTGLSQEPRPFQSTAAQSRPSGTDSTTDTNAILRSARIIFVRSKSAFLKSSDLENELRKRPEFSQLSLLISKDEDAAELILEVGRKVPGTKFVYSAIDPKTQLVVASGSARSHPILPSSSVGHKIAKKFLRQVQAVRP
jgi:hypothetical protein